VRAETEKLKCCQADKLYNPHSVRFERALPGTNEVFSPDGVPRPVYQPVLDELERTGHKKWEEKLRRAHGLLLEEQRSFGILEGDKTHPTDWIPRLVPASDWERLRAGLEQRLRAINEFLRRLEAGKEEIVPREVIESSILYDVKTKDRFGAVPVRQIAFDVVAVESGRSGETGGWEYVVIEENAKMPVGLAAMTRRRRMCGEIFFPHSYEGLPIYSLDGWLDRLGDALRAASKRGPEATLAVVTSGPDDQFYLDHHIYAKEMGAVIAETKDLHIDEDGYLVHGPSGDRIDVIYERVDEDTLYAEVPGLLECHLTGNVHVLFAPNSEIIDDKGVYPFIPEMIRTYLGEQPILNNAETWSLALEEDRRYVMEHFDELVVKSRSGWGGKDVLIAPEESKEAVEDFRREVEENPAEYVAQRPLEFSTHVLCETTEDDFLLRDSYADYRVHALAPEAGTVEVVPGAMTRVAAPGSKLVNISSGGKMKDTWVLRE
jgi:uncharacterized circularly permuted ATP-grasp superfamily protein